MCEVKPDHQTSRCAMVGLSASCLPFHFAKKTSPGGSVCKIRLSPHLLQCSGDQLLHDFSCATIDALYTCICPHFTNGVFLHKPISAMQLQAFI